MTVTRTSGAAAGVAGGVLTGSYPNPGLGAGVVTDTNVAAANKDGVAGTLSLRTLGTGAQQAAAGTHTHPESAITGLVTDLAAKAPLISPGFSGVPTVPTATLGTNTNQAASTAFVLANATGGGGGGAPVSVEWAPTTAYVTGQLVSHVGVLYQATTGFTSGSSFSTTNLAVIAVVPGSVVMTGTVPFTQGGVAATGPSMTWRAPTSGTVTGVNLSALVGPTGSGLIVQYRRNGTMYATLTMPAGSSAAQTSAPSQAFSAGDLLDVNATSVGSTTPAQDVAAQVDYQQVLA